MHGPRGPDGVATQGTQPDVPRVEAHSRERRSPVSWEAAPASLHPCTCARARANREDLLDSEHLAAGVNVGTCTPGKRIRNFV